MADSSKTQAKQNIPSSRYKKTGTRFRPWTLGGRLALWNALIIFFALVIKGAILYQVLTSLLIADLDGRLQSQAYKLQHILQTSQEHSLNQKLLQQLVRGDEVTEFITSSTYIKLFDKDSRHLLAFSPQLSRITLPFNQGDFESALHGQQPLHSWQDNNGNEVHTLTVALRDTHQHIVVVAQICQSMQIVKQVQTVLIWGLAISISITSLLTYFACYWLTNRELRPLKKLSTTMHTLSFQNMQPLTRLNVEHSSAEIQHLAEAFNQMMERLENSFAIQKNFVSDISHEIRTPLTAIQGQLDVMLLDPEIKDGMREDLQRIGSETRRLTRLVANLLTTTRAETGMLSPLNLHTTQPVELDLLLVEIARQASFLHAERKVEVEQLEQITIQGDIDLLRQLLLNLVDNALTYAGEHGTISLRLVRTSPAVSQPREIENVHRDWARLTVCDTGPGIDPTDMPRIFERYYRGKNTSAQSKLGAGLGLAIARLIAEAHGGYITVESEQNEETCFDVWLPISTTIPAGQQESV